MKVHCTLAHTFELLSQVNLESAQITWQNETSSSDVLTDSLQDNSKYLVL